MEETTNEVRAVASKCLRSDLRTIFARRLSKDGKLTVKNEAAMNKAIVEFFALGGVSPDAFRMAYYIVADEMAPYIVSGAGA